jgi:hypothetical protein
MKQIAFKIEKQSKFGAWIYVYDLYKVFIYVKNIKLSNKY